jgi:hypothetical protein
MIPIFILTDTYHNARRCAERLEIKHWRYVKDTYTLIGILDGVAIITDTFSHHPKNSDISQMLTIYSNRLQTIYINMDRYMI